VVYSKKIIGVLIFSFVLYASCLYSRTGVPSITITAGIEIYSGNAIVRIDGKINENLYFSNTSHNMQEVNFNDDPAIREGSITKNETRIMTTGEEYSFSILPTETVTINIRSLDGNDVELIVYRQGKKEKHTIKSTSILGSTIGFQNK